MEKVFTPEIEEAFKEIARDIAKTIAKSNRLYVVIHHEGVRIDSTAADIKNYHCNVLKWSRAGYHNVIRQDGSIWHVEPINVAVNGMYWGEKGEYTEWCSNSYQVCFTRDEPTSQQKESIILLLREIIVANPDIKIGIHRDFPGQPTECPGYTVTADWLAVEGIPEKNIFRSVK